jgi:O-antigen/teichoic acid export membrane protein
MNKYVTRLPFWGRIEPHWVIISNAASLIGTFGVTSGLGFVYWWVAAQLFDKAEVGLASALISAMMLMGTLGMLGLGTLMIGELRRRRAIAVSLISGALVVASITAGSLGLIFALITSQTSDEFAILTDTGYLLLFVVGTAVTGALLVLDQALLGLLRGTLQLYRNAIFAAGKLLILAVVGLAFVNLNSMAIYATWLAGNLLSIIPLAFIALPHLLQQHEMVSARHVFRELRGAALAHHVLNVSVQTSQFALPVLVTFLFSAVVNASFYVAWLIVSILFIIPAALTQTLYAVSSAEDQASPRQIRLTLRLSLFFVSAGVLVLVVGAPLILGIFGQAYADQASPSLRIMALAAFPMIIKVHYIAIFQIRRKIRLAALAMLGGALLELTLAFLGGATGNLWALSVGWTGAIFIEAILTAPEVYRASRR